MLATPAARDASWIGTTHGETSVNHVVKRLEFRQGFATFRLQFGLHRGTHRSIMYSELQAGTTMTIRTLHSSPGETRCYLKHAIKESEERDSFHHTHPHGAFNSEEQCVYGVQQSRNHF